MPVKAAFSALSPWAQSLNHQIGDYATSLCFSLVHPTHFHSVQKDHSRDVTSSIKTILWTIICDKRRTDLICFNQRNLNSEYSISLWEKRTNPKYITENTRMIDFSHFTYQRWNFAKPFAKNDFFWKAVSHISAVKTNLAEKEPSIELNLHLHNLTLMLVSHLLKSVKTC